MSFDRGSSLFIAASNGRHLLTNYLIEQDAKFISKKSQQDLLQVTVKTDNISYLRKYFSEEGILSKLFYGVDKTALLHLAAKSGSHRCFKELFNVLGKEAFATSEGNGHILSSAMEGGSSEIIRLLLKSGIDNNVALDTNNNNACHLAIKYGFISLLESFHN
ncbi:ankyrin repeat domain-containing protein [Candidatus Lariskella endosymbiont of Hedychridium roseum]|uniref:ankyrin repeat domain-containing protein n=1 Tax=Candidatus Lariskella endosymbiont of Hedychridium roseum TaxID=3077949 RepID=UPI0030D4E7A7